MANNQKFTLTFDAQLNIVQMKGSLDQIRTSLSSLKLPASLEKGLQGTFQKLSQEVQNYEKIISQGINSDKDMKSLSASAEKILQLYTKLENEFKNIKNASPDVLKKMFPVDVANNIEKATKALNNYKTTINDLNNKISSKKSELEKYQASLDVIKRTQAELQSKDVEKVNGLNVNEENLNKLKVAWEELSKASQAYLDKVGAASEKDLTKGQKSYFTKLKNNIEAAKQAYEQMQSAMDTKKGLVNAEKDVTKYEESIRKIKNELAGLEQVLPKQQGDALKQLFEDLSKIKDLDLSKFGNNAESVEKAIQQLVNQALTNLKTNLDGVDASLEKTGKSFNKNAEDARKAIVVYSDFERRLQDVQSIKNRIQYFFGLSNAINLFKRAVRGAFETVKELDAAMTETAVVTQNTVSDMWAKLPEYTKRANELGVSTLDAYKAATLYYQQGLNDDQAAALSVETLKMARIAGLEAADATDRMTNALRGFNMELDAVNAQKVDDVYSQLAAMSASNVDEISTAMTKVASLAHSANMEFETTAAFLAQIIETTRESAETAGTALKTVVARFSEVKKLYDMDELKGKDEEGQNIDINKVSSALRTAGIDLNKYFLGEVGLDDIFMELASKWDTLTSVQQRYIATQAAGSRQQSRFIALMQDYARTQELVSAAYKSNGASAKQFEKTQESLQSKLARLKNAWNEFLMGLANNVVIKKAVDVLTTLLNIINKLTGAFGDGVGGVLKFFTALGVLRGVGSLFSNSGLITRGLAKFGGTNLGKMLFPGASKVAAEMAAKESAKVGLWTKLFGASTGTASTSTAGIGTGAGLGTLAIPAAVITAIVAAVVGTVAIQDYLKSGKKEVKEAEKAVEVQKKAAEQQKKVADLQSDAYKRYIENEKIFNNSTDRVEKTNAKAAMAEALADLARIDKNNIINDNGTYKVNKKYSQQLQERLEEEQKITVASGNLAQAALQFAQAQKAEKAVMVNTAYGKYGQWENVGGSWWQDTKWDLTHIGLNEDERYLAIQQYNTQQQALAEQYRAAAQPELMAAAEQLLQDKYTSDIVDSVASAYSKLFNGDNFQNQVAERANNANLFDWISNFTLTAAKTLYQYGPNKQEYESIYGQGSAKGLAPWELATALGQRQAVSQQQTNIEQLVKLALDKNGSVILDIINGTFDQFYQGGELESALDKLTSSQKNTLAKILGVEVAELQDTLTQYSTSLIKAQSKIRKNTIRVLTKAGVKNTQYLDEVSTQLTMSQQAELTKVAETFSGYGLQFNDAIAETFSNALMNDTYDDVFKDFVTSISDNPILAYDTLRQAAEGTNQELQQLVDQLGLINKTSGKFDVSGFEQFSRQNLVQSFFASDAYDNLTEQVEKFIEANGKITSANIEELSDECKTLSILLDNDIMSADGLAIAFNALEEGNITLFDLNENVLELYNSFDSVANAIQRAGQFIKNFDPGEDWGDAFDFIDGAIEKMQGFIDNRELGNPQLRNYWKAFFTTDPKDLEDWEAGLAILKELQGNGGADFWTKAIGFSMDENGVIADMGIDAFASSSFNNYKDYIKSLAESNGFTQFTDEYYDLMLRNMGDHDYGVLTDIAAVEMDKMMTAYGEGMPSKADIQAIADGYGIEPQDVLDAWLEKYGDGTQLNFSELEDKIRRTTTSIKDAAETALSGLREDFINGRVGLGDTEGEASRAWNANMGNTSWILQQLGVGPDGTFSIDTLYAKIGQIIPEVQNGTITPQEWIQEQIDKSPNGKVTLPVDFDYQKKIGDNQYETQHFHADVEIDSVEGYEKAISDAMAEANAVSLSQPIQDAITEANSLAEIIAALGTENNISAVKGEITNCITDANTLNTTLGQTINKTVVVNAEPSSIEISGAGRTISFSISAVASGGVVKSAASGTVNPGLALTGEEAPEIVWNKEKGYAYLAGENGPEINNLQPGDEVFNGEQTKQILKRSGISSFAKGTISSYAGTIWKRDDPSSPGTGGGGSGGSGSGSGDYEKESTWRNELDWLYNLMEDIAEYERQQTILQSKYDLALEDLSSTGRDLFQLTQKELVNLETQLKAQETAQIKRLQQMGELQTQVNAADYGQYIQWNNEDQTLEIDWDAIEAIQDKDTYDEVTDWLERMEEVQDQIDDATDAIWDVKEQIQELQNRYLEQYLDFQNKVMDAVVASYQQTIDNLSELNDKINDTNTSILDSIQKEIDLERQIRDNTDTEKNIAEMESRLAYLQRDTTGANDVQIKQLEKQLQDARESYSDTLVDQAVDRLQQQNDIAATQREKQIELMQAQLDYWQESGGLWDEVADLIATGFTSSGSIIQGSDLWEVLKSSDAWDAMSEAQKKNWANELILETNEVGAHLIQLSGGNAVNSEEVRASIADQRGVLTQDIAAAAETVRASIDSLTGQLGGTPEHSFIAEKTDGYASGGLNSKTGPALLHGTPSEPEYVLNARQTDAFLQLAEVLPSVMSGGAGTTNNYGGNINFSVDVNVGSIANDYDVDSLVARIKDNLYDVVSYRNTNSLGFLR